MLWLPFALLALLTPPQEKEPTEEEAPKGSHETVVVTASRQEQPLLESTSLVTVLSRDDLRRSPALVLDDALRQVPGFSLFRRSSSMISHPTTQGVSLRGIGPSGTSRTLVLFDGIPWNDPFGGWVYWNRIPRTALESVEVVRGATSPLYGSTALGGTIQLRPSRHQRRFDVRGVLGSHKYADLDLAASDRIGNWGYLAAARVLDTDGFFIIDDALRGEVDTPANSRFETFFGRVSYKRFHVGVNTFRERRSNGTRLQQNDSRIALLETGIEGDSWQSRFYVQSGLFKNTFSRVLSDRSREFVTARQEFPTLGTGGSLTWSPRGGLLVGTDWRRVSWQDRAQNLAGLFVQQTLPLHSRLDLQLGARTDWWQGRTTETSLNPRLGVLLRGSEWLTLRSSAYRGFRAPTLNELYRPFRVGNVITAENPDLGEENLWGGELGADLHPSGSVLFRINGFWNSLRDPVGNATVSVGPRFIQRQRQNLGQVRVRGLELETGLEGDTPWSLRMGYLYSQTEVRETGLRLPQVPNHQFTAEIGYEGPVAASLQGRWVGDQFEDDRNSMVLERFFLLGASVRKPLGESLEIFLAVENLLDRDYVVRLTPLPSLGIPRLVYGGVQLRLR